jgi:Ca2+-binding RTX toxin-like protein
MHKKKKPGNPKGQGTPNVINNQNYDYRLPTPPWLAASDSSGDDATLDLTGLSSIPLDILNRGTVRQINSDDYDGFAYDILIWQLDDAAVGFAQEVNSFQELSSATDNSGSFISKRVNIPLIANSAIQSAVVLIADSAYPTAQAGTETSDLLIGNQDSNGTDGGEGDDVILGLEDRDSLVGNRGNDLINGGSGDDVLVGNSGNDQLYGEEGSDRLNGLDGDDTLRGGSGNDFIYGGDGNDTLYGGSGNDQLAGQAGSDTLYGGAGNDIYFLDDTEDVIVELANQGSDTVRATFNNVVLQSDLENLTLVGLDAVTGNGNNLDNIITIDDEDPSNVVAIDRVILGLGGNDQIATEEGNDQVDGGAGADRIRVGAENDTVNGGDGDDELDGSGNDDTLSGGNGNDILFGDWGTNILNGGQGNDTLFSGGSDTLTGGTGADTFSFPVLSSANVTIQDFNPNESDRIRLPNFVFVLGIPAVAVTAADFSYAAGALSVFTAQTGTVKVANVTFAPGTSFDRNRDLVVGSRVDFNSTISLTLPPAAESEPVVGLSLNGTANSDRLWGDEGIDLIRAAAGNDIVSGLEGNDDLAGGLGDDTLDGGSGNDRVQGEEGDDNLYGEAGNDTVEGGNGNDKLTGGAGNDTLTGGAGADSFNFYDPVLEPFDDAGGDRRDPAIDGVDIITDFNVGKDKIGLYGGLYGGDSPYRLAGLTLNSSLTADRFQVGAAATDGGDRLIYNSGNGALFFDADGTGASAQIQIATLTAGLALSHTDFFVFGDTTASLGSDNLTGTGGNDNINGGNGDDNINGGDGADKLIGGKDDDRLTGGGGNDDLIGGAGKDRLYGGAGKDRLNGGAGKDRLYGGLGSDRLTGGKDKDIFALEKGAGRDLILDFKDGQDRLGLTPGLKFKKLAIVSQGQSTLIRLGNDPLALLKGVQSSSLSAADFVSIPSS